MTIMFPCSFVQTDLHESFAFVLMIASFFPPCLLIQVYGVLDVQRVAGNFHISVHGLNIFIAQQVSSFIFMKYSFM